MQKNVAISIEQREEFLNTLLCKKSFEEKFQLLEESNRIPSEFLLAISSLSVLHKYVLSVLYFLDQEHILLGWEKSSLEEIETLANILTSVETAFSFEGGLIGYQRIVEALLADTIQEEQQVFPPEPIVLKEESEEVRKSIFSALYHLEKLAELYPVGGAADRLNLSDPVTKKRLPAAKLGFLDKSLLEGMVDDVKAREFLAYKLFGKQVRTPIGLMTSSERNNHNHILELCGENNWFQRGKDAFFLFSQPLVPCITKEGKWIRSDRLKIEVKPGGHGMIWLLAREKKVLHFFKRYNRSKILLRQINNPIAGIDFGLLAFIGYGLVHNKGFGFSSCPRKAGAKEGMNVVIENSEGCFLTNLEYCDFEKYGVDIPSKGYGHYPANTNLLFADCIHIEQALKKNPLPGKILNFSSKGNGIVSARLETMMQNIADVIPSKHSYLTLNARNKTIATAKKAYIEGEGIFETPLGAFYTYLFNAYELLTTHCDFQLPPFPGADLFEQEGPPFVFTYHPALGPLYSIISQKIQRGMLAEKAMLKLEIADILIRDLEVHGALSIAAENIVGHVHQGMLTYSEMTGKCVLENVRVESNLTITLKGNGAFLAQGISFSEDLDIIVPHGMVATAMKTDYGISIIYSPKTSLRGVVYRYDDSYLIHLSFDEMLHSMQE